MNTEGILLAITVALWAAGWIVLGRVRRCGLGDVGKSLSAERLSIIIPARNEEKNLPTLLRSINAQSIQPLEILVVNDASTDGTAEVAREHGARVINSQPLPEDWRGKTWACHQGAQAATGDLLLFLDADTWFEPEGLAQTLAACAAGTATGSSRRESALTPNQMERTGVRCHEPLGAPRGAFSVVPFHAVRRAYENLSLFFNFNMTVGTVPDGLFGQMLLVDRESYRRVCGHEAVKGRTLENFFLAQQFRAAGIPTRSATGRGVFAFRMYPNGLREMVEGWTKGFAAGAGQTPRGVLLLVVAWMIGLMLAPIGWAVTGDWWRWGAAYLLCVAQVAWFSRQIGAFRWFTALLYPVPLVFFFAVFARSAMRSGKRVTWKGREIRAD
jgi:4,4'-diaponeurosporenoate glycosyltransferase